MDVFQGRAAAKAGRNIARGLGARGETSEPKNPVEQALPDAGT